MKTLSFHEFRTGHAPGRPIIAADTGKDRVSLRPGLSIIIAPNGRGKSTLLRAIAGLPGWTEGRVTLDGRDVRPEADVLYVSEYLAFPKYVYPQEWLEFVAGGRATESSSHWIAAFRLGDRMGTFVGKLSQGERRKLTWAAAHASSRPVLLLDEPLDGLDLEAMEAARGLVRAWKREGRVVCVVAHQPWEFLDLCDQVLVVRQGRLVNLEGAPLTAESLRERVLAFYRGPGAEPVTMENI